MAIRNILLGGASNFALNEKPISSVDMNDTFNAAVTKIQSLSAFWLNSDLYDVYDDFNAETTGAFVSNTNWDISVTTKDATHGQGYADIVESTNAGGDIKELRLGAKSNESGYGYDAGNAIATTKLLISNKHTFVRLNWTAAGGSTNDPISSSYIVEFGNTTDGWTTIFTQTVTVGSSGAPTLIPNSVFVAAKGSNIYNVYTGGKSSGDLTKANGAQLKFTISVGGNESISYMYIDDIRQSKSTITA